MDSVAQAERSHEHHWALRACGKTAARLPHSKRAAATSRDPPTLHL